MVNVDCVNVEGREGRGRGGGGEGEGEEGRRGGRGKGGGAVVIKPPWLASAPCPQIRLRVSILLSPKEKR